MKDEPWRGDPAKRVRHLEAKLSQKKRQIREHEARVAELTAEVERLKEALTPSGETKAAYFGEFSETHQYLDEDGEEQVAKRYVSWTTIKRVMEAIRDRAASD